MINDESKEVLSELINIAFGSATAAIADLFDNFATLHVPAISVVTRDRMQSFILDGFDDANGYITTQQFKGEFEGELLFIIDEPSAGNMQMVICETEALEDDEALDPTEIQQSILEISNILGSSCIGKLAEQLGTGVSFAPPMIDRTRNLYSGLEDTRYDHIIVISTVLEFKDIQILGKLFILFNDAMFAWLEKALEDLLENM